MTIVQNDMCEMGHVIVTGMMSLQPPSNVIGLDHMTST